MEDEDVDDDSPRISQKKLKELKNLALEDQIKAMCDNLGDPRYYYPQLRSKGILSKEDCQLINHEVTEANKVMKFVDLLTGRVARDGSTAFDVLVEVLKSEGRHTDLARGLQRSLEKLRQEEAGLNSKYATGIADPFLFLLIGGWGAAASKELYTCSLISCTGIVGQA